MDWASDSDLNALRVISNGNNLSAIRIVSEKLEK